jgi:hypothetical protein
MQKFLLTLLAVASLIIAAITAKSDEESAPVLGRDVTIGGVTTHYGAPVFVPDTTSGGKWVAFPARTLPAATASDHRYETLLAEAKNKLTALVTPTVSLENGIVVGHGVLSFNHDGRAYAGYISNHSIAKNIDILNDQQTQSNLDTLQKEYRQNIKSGKWKKFVNGD